MFVIRYQDMLSIAYLFSVSSRLISGCQVLRFVPSSLGENPVISLNMEYSSSGGNICMISGPSYIIYYGIALGIIDGSTLMCTLQHRKAWGMPYCY